MEVQITIFLVVRLGNVRESCSHHHHRNMYLVDQTALHYVVVRRLLPILQYKIEIHVVLFIKFYYFHFFYDRI